MRSVISGHWGLRSPSRSAPMAGDGGKSGGSRPKRSSRRFSPGKTTGRMKREGSKQREARRAARKTRMEERIRTYIEQNPGEGISTRELRENIEIRCDTIAGVLNGMLEEGWLLRRRKGKQKVLWSLAEGGNRQRTQSGEKPLKTGSRFVTASQKSETNGNRCNVSMNSRTYPVENQGLTRARTGGEKREPVLGTGLHPEAETERNQGSGKDSPRT